MCLNSRTGSLDVNWFLKSRTGRGTAEGAIKAQSKGVLEQVSTAETDIRTPNRTAISCCTCSARQAFGPLLRRLTEASQVVIEGVSVEETGGAARHQAGNREDSAASGAAARARSIEQPNRTNSNGRIPVRGPALRTHDQGGDDSAQPSSISSGSLPAPDTSKRRRSHRPERLPARRKVSP